MKELSNIEVINELRCLRSALTSTANKKILGLLDEAVNRIAENVKTDYSASGPIAKPQQGIRITKKDRMQKYL